jgi:ATP-dependent Lhr-like helicase
MASPNEQLDVTLKLLCDQPYQAALWENVILPARVGKYRPEMLDALLAQGNIFWHNDPNLGLCFHLYEDIDWEADLAASAVTLEDNEKIIYEALLKRGASFMQRLSGILCGVSPHDTLLGLSEKGILCADSFLPIRQMLNREKLKNSTAKQRVNARVSALNNGRWELLRPLIKLSVEAQLERIFDRVIVLSRETIQSIPWDSVLEILRVWEYTGRVRRGYFVEGMSGIQFIREKDFAGIMIELQQPRDEIIWLPAVDPAQLWGKCLCHMEGRGFLNVPGTVVALQSGVPVAVLERQGKVLRVFDSMALSETLQVFADAYAERRLFPTINRVIIKEYPQEAVDALMNAGFSREIQDYVLYRD